MKRLLVLVGLLLAAIQPAASQQPAAACAVLAADPERLACYDGLFRTGPATPGEVPGPGLVEITSIRPIPAFPTGREPAVITLACRADGVEASFRFAGQPMSSTGDIAPITFQVDGGATSVRSLSASPDNTSVSFRPGRDSLAFLDGLNGRTSLKIRITPVRQQSILVEFRLPEVADAIAALRAGCPG